MLAEYLQLLVVSKYNFSRSPCILLLCVCMLVCCVTGMQELSSLTLPVKTWTFLSGKATDTSLPLPLPLPFLFSLPLPFLLPSPSLSLPFPFPSFSHPLFPLLPFSFLSPSSLPLPTSFLYLPFAPHSHPLIIKKYLLKIKKSYSF